VIGCLHFASHTLNEISPSDIPPLEGVTAQIGNAIGRILAENQIRELNKELAAIIDFLPDATFVIDAKGQVIAWNRAIEQMTGIPKEDMIGKGNDEYSIALWGDPRPLIIDFALNDDEGEAELLYDVFQVDGDIYYGEMESTQVFGGRGAYLSETAAILYDSNGNMSGSIESVRDITALKESKNEMKKVVQDFKHLTNNFEHVLSKYDEF
jgi:PAS domain S-box-containing protein